MRHSPSLPQPATLPFAKHAVATWIVFPSRSVTFSRGQAVVISAPLHLRPKTSGLVASLAYSCCKTVSKEMRDPWAEIAEATMTSDDIVSMTFPQPRTLNLQTTLCCSKTTTALIWYDKRLGPNWLEPTVLQPELLQMFRSKHSKICNPQPNTSKGVPMTTIGHLF